jgi:hypothetical protein
LQIAVSDQARYGLAFVVRKVGNPLFPDVTGVVDSILSLFVGIVQLVERLLVFHGLSLRRSQYEKEPEDRVNRLHLKSPSGKLFVTKVIGAG